MTTLGSRLVVHCRRCRAYLPEAATHVLSSHPTSEGVVTYFRCAAGHTDFYLEMP